jgi:long-chain acyl-CoA synthetase
VLGSLVADAALRSPTHPAVVWPGGQLTYDELHDRISRFSAHLAVRGIGPGDVVAMVLPNTPEFVVTFFAAVRRGAVVLPLNRQFHEPELRHYVDDSGARAVLADEETAGLCSKVVDGLGATVIRVDEPTSTASSEDDVETAGADALFQYSSGSTGASKRVVRTAAALRAEADHFAATTELTPDDTILCPVPLFHAHGLGNGLLAAARAGATLVLLEGLQRQAALQLVQERRCTLFPGVPLMFRVLADTRAAERADLSSLRLCFSAGGPLPRPTFDDFHARTGLYARQLYGCTEAGSVTMNLDVDPTASAESVGRPFRDVGVQILDEDGGPVPAGQTGDVAITGPNLFRGYLHGSHVDRSAFVGEWFVTGDTGRLDADGRLTITGRRTSFINTAGHKVDPEEVEAVIGRMPSVAEVVVLGVPGPDGAEVVKAVVIADGAVLRQEIVETCAQHLAAFKVPRIVEFRDELPRNPLGKILKKYLI